ncbi:MAG: alpha/beta fold hydrolase [Cyclobacteriaceae bacterium]|nr:alpha/beta fold hydrolase [Cyclobacteriaceae bacterium]
MKYLLSVFSMIMLLAISSAAQTSKLQGNWDGRLYVQANTSIKLVFHIRDSIGLSATVDSPDQGAFGIKCDEVSSKGDSVFIILNRLRAKFSGSYSVEKDTAMLKGNWQQGPAKLPLNLRRSNLAQTKLDRPQQPKEPFAYNVEDVQYSSKDGKVTLGATLTTPKGDKKYPAVILITGSGQQDRDETLLGHKPFWVIADYLTSKGYAVLRVDDRGVGKSKGDLTKATSLDFAEDVITSLEFLKKHKSIDVNAIGLIGHSEGGLIASLVSSRRKDIAFMILLSSPGVTGSKIVEEQGMAVIKSNGVSASVAEELRPLTKESYRIIISAATKEKAHEEFLSVVKAWYPKASTQARQVIGATTEQEAATYAKRSVDQLYNPWFRFFLEHDPAAELKKSSCPVLALFGEKDIQVLPSQNKEPMTQSLKASRKKSGYEVVEMPGLNHLFQHCKKCSVDEYAVLSETFAPEVLEKMAQWLNTNVKK